MQINPNNSNINFNKYNLSGNPLGIMPQHLISKVTSFLDKNSIQNIALLNNGICKSVKAAANFNESNLIKNFIQTLIQKLNVGIYPEQREQLVGIEQNIVLQNFANLRLLKEYILNVKEQIIGVIKTLDEETTNNLVNHVQPPNFFKNILELVALERQIDAANFIPDAFDRSHALLGIVKALVQADNIDRAIGVTVSIPNENVRGRALQDIFKALTRAGGIQADNIDRAFAVAELIPNARDRSHALQDISKVLTQAGNIDRAIDVATLINDEYVRGCVLQDIFKVLMQAGDIGIDKAIAIAISFHDEYMRWDALWIIHRALEKAGNIDKATAIAELIPKIPLTPVRKS